MMIATWMDLSACVCSSVEWSVRQGGHRADPMGGGIGWTTLGLLLLAALGMALIAQLTAMAVRQRERAASVYRPRRW